MRYTPTCGATRVESRLLARGLAGKSGKQKLNTRSSTEAELVGASDYLPHALWVKLFMEAQGYVMTEAVLEQDNESTIRVEENGRMSAGPRSRHIDIRYFWIKDRTKQANITVRHCPTLQMLGDFFTKPLQGGLFRKFRDALLGLTHVNTLVDTPAPSPEERVGKNQAVEHGYDHPGELGTETKKSRLLVELFYQVSRRSGTKCQKHSTTYGPLVLKLRGLRWCETLRAPPETRTRCKDCCESILSKQSC